MHIKSIGMALPEYQISNADLLGLLRARLPEGPAGETEATVGQIARVLWACGSDQRFLAPHGRGYAINLLKQATQDALGRAEVSPAEIDLIIYCGVARGWLEPSTAAALQRAVGATNASCFDVLEACASWVRALELADALMRAGRYRNVLVAGVEAGMQACLGLTDAPFTVSDEHLAGFTIGEAATATLVTPEGPALDCRIASFGDAFDTCMIPLANADAFLEADLGPVPQAGRFMSHGDRLFRRAIMETVDICRRKLAEIGSDEINLFILHGASERASEIVRQALGAPKHKWLCGHTVFGNTVSMSMPTALRHAEDKGLIRRGDRIMFVVASAGISAGYGIVEY
jgi:3-oxoacyl-[acyl-carrier-protein] synthase III